MLYFLAQKEDILINTTLDKSKVRNLLDKSRRGFFRGIFSRVTVIAVLILLQLAFLFSSFIWLTHYRIWFELFGVFLTVSSVLYLVNSDMDALSRLTWLILVMITPVLGSLFLVYTKIDFGYRGFKRRMSDIVETSSPYLVQNQDVIDRLKEETSNTYHLTEYFKRSAGHFPIYHNTDVTYFPTGETFFESLKTELLKAEKYIFMEFFIIAEGIMWGEILAILEQKAKEGVEVRILYDGMIEFSTLSFDYTQRLKKIGIKAKAFSPISPFVSTYYNYRDHRKIVVIDGKIAYTGGINLADEYINKLERFGHWKDTGLMLKGEAVDSFLVLFLQMWSLTEKEVTIRPYLVTHEDREAEGYVIPYGDSPLDRDKIGENVYIDILNHARNYVYITTPYLILDSELEHALRFAAERGVDVRIILPGIPDKKIPYTLAKTYFKCLMDSGVKIYTYTPGFIHAKVFVSDNHKAVVGTINLDYRSLYHHFECATYLYRVSAIDAIYKDYMTTLAASELVTMDTIRAIPATEKLLGIVAKTIAPLM